MLIDLTCESFHLLSHGDVLIIDLTSLSVGTSLFCPSDNVGNNSIGAVVDESFSILTLSSFDIVVMSVSQVDVMFSSLFVTFVPS